MLTDDDVRLEIISAKEGCDIHGLIDKIANQLHSDNPTNSEESDWFFAQTILYKWTEHEHRTNLREEPGFGFQVTRLLNHYAYNAYKNDKSSCKGTSFDYWMRAQNELAEQVIRQTGRA